MEFIPINTENRQEINDFIRKEWYTTEIIVRGEAVDMTTIDGIIVYDQLEIIGLATYRIDHGELEIMSLNSVRENRGTGTELLKHIHEIAREKNCIKIKLITTNDNINAIRFYQKRGFDLVQLYHNALEVSRKLKPSIPELGEHGIPLRHELEFELIL